jgi:hypothetical protein
MTDSAQDRHHDMPLAADGLFLGLHRPAPRVQRLLAIGAIALIGLLCSARVALTLLGAFLGA